MCNKKNKKARLGIYKELLEKNDESLLIIEFIKV